MEPREICEITGRSKSWLQRHECGLCEGNLWRIYRFNCCHSMFGAKCTREQHLARAAAIKAAAKPPR